MPFQSKYLQLLVSALLLGTATAASLPPRQEASDCKAWPETESWPAAAKWTALSEAVPGKLEAVVPPGAVCHNTFNGKQTYDRAKCQEYTSAWGKYDLYLDSPVGIYWDFWSNRTCTQTQDPNAPCTKGTYPEYVIKANTVADIQAGVNFARENNVRLIIKNTGHDFMGKSIGPGSLSIWTHQLTDIEIIDKYDDPSTDYTGSAVKLGAGWQIRDIYNKLGEIGKVIIAGECPTVGFSGGFIQGGGHGPLSGIHGLGTDSVLSFEVVTADGKFVTADAKQNSDLFWALRGGGGATWGVVVSVTVMTHDSPAVSGAVLSFTVSDQNIFWKALDAFHEFAPTLADEGIFGYYEISSRSLSIKPLFAPGKTQAELTALIAPLLAKFDALRQQYTSQVTSYPNFLAGYKALFDDEFVGGNMFTSSRLILREHVEKNHTAVTEAFRNAADAGLFIIGHLVAPGVFGGAKDETSVNPVWKKALLLPLYNANWQGNENEAQKWALIRKMIEETDAPFKAVSPGSGTYLNEANIYEPDWQNDFYGTNYARLLKIKEEVDPKDVFWAKTAVGSDKWVEVNGRLCRA
ncbi:FAD binding domain-containing protein [Peziza echinospora]|nr:FAD binding domain-containing protein [Peziza echinospora]